MIVLAELFVDVPRQVAGAAGDENSHTILQKLAVGLRLALGSAMIFARPEKAV